MPFHYFTITLDFSFLYFDGVTPLLLLKNRVKQAAEDKRELFCEGMRRILLHERALLYRMLEGGDGVAGLRHIRGVTVFLDTDDLTKRDLIVAIKIENIDAAECVKEYIKRGVTVCERSKSGIYSKRILDSLGIDDVIRVSPLHCHSGEDIDKFLQVTADIANCYCH